MIAPWVLLRRRSGIAVSSVAVDDRRASLTSAFSISTARMGTIGLATDRASAACYAECKISAAAISCL